MTEQVSLKTTTAAQIYCPSCRLIMLEDDDTLHVYCVNSDCLLYDKPYHVIMPEVCLIPVPIKAVANR